MKIKDDKFTEEQLDEELNRYGDRVSGESIDNAEKNAEKFKTDKRISHLWEKIQMMFIIARNPKSYGYKVALGLGAALIYLVSPLDLIPDPTPVIGLMDDIAAITTAVTTASSEIKRIISSNPDLLKIFPEKLRPVVKKTFKLDA